MTNPQYEAIIFDFFDVIHADPFQRWLKSHGWKREGPMHEASVALDKGLIDVSEFFRRVSAVCSFPPEQIRTEFDSHNKFDQDVIALIGDLVENYQVGLISNGPSGFVRSLLKKAGIEDTFHHIVISSEVGMVKPQPEIFEHMLAKMGVKPAVSIFIDDNPKNVTAAEALGMQGIVYTDLSSLQSELRRLGVRPT